MKLALQYPEHQCFIIDNFSRRKLVKKIGGLSLTPISSLKHRIAVFQKTFQRKNLHYYQKDILSKGFLSLLRKYQPDIIYHLAQQPSAHYSMRNMKSSTSTIQNNEIGNLQLLWYLKDYLPNTHFIKLGSFGEYAECGLNIPEGYFLPEYKGKKAIVRTPFPREADDVYHISKINDTNFISMACRKWGLCVTDIMQSTIFGLSVKPFTAYHALFTRFDYDEYFGTIINRFLVQSLLSIPLTIYGTGYQRTGLMSLEDAVTSLANILMDKPQPGEHRVINHVAEKLYSVNEIATLVQKVSASKSIQTHIDRGVYNPRNEILSNKHDYDIETDYLHTSAKMHSIEEVLSDMFDYAEKCKEYIKPSIIRPSFEWC